MYTIRRSDTPQDRTDRMSEELISALTAVLKQWNKQQHCLGAKRPEIAAAIVRAMAVMSAKAYHGCGYGTAVGIWELARELVFLQFEFLEQRGTKGDTENA